MLILRNRAVVITLGVVDLFEPIALVQISDTDRTAEINAHIILFAQPERHIQQVIIFFPGGRTGVFG